MKVIGKGRPKWFGSPTEGGNYQVFDVYSDAGIVICIVTVYDNNHRTYEFDNEQRYSHGEVQQILNIGSRLDSRAKEREVKT